MELAKEVNPSVRFDGAQFAVIANWKGCEFYYLYQFKHSIPASKAVGTDFTATIVYEESGEILPRTEHTTIRIDLQLTTVACATAAAATAAASKLESVCELISKSSENVFDKQSIITIIRNEVPGIPDFSVQLPPVPVQLPHEELELDETTKNRIVCAAVRRKAEKMGFIVTTNTSGSGNSRASKYYNSRPDLAMYKENCGFIVMESSACEELTDETTTATTAALHGGMTENKNKINSDVEGQLLAGMEKVAGDLAYQQLKQAKEKVFQCIYIYGLVIDFENLKCKPYKLTMDFVSNSCILSIGRQELDLDDGITRLVSKLERTNA